MRLHLVHVLVNLMNQRNERHSTKERFSKRKNLHIDNLLDAI